MKTIQPLLLLAAGALASGLALPQDPTPPPAAGPGLEARIAQLEGQVAELEGWVEAQKAQARATQKALGVAEEKGFTKGINFESREVLLAAWRAEAQKRIDGAGSAEDADEPQERGDRGRGDRGRTR